MAKAKRSKQVKQTITWRQRYPNDRYIPSLTRWPSPESLHPTESTMTQAIFGEEEARAIIAAWAPTLVPVRYVEALP